MCKRINTVTNCFVILCRCDHRKHDNIQNREIERNKIRHFRVRMREEKRKVETNPTNELLSELTVNGITMTYLILL